MHPGAEYFFESSVCHSCAGPALSVVEGAAEGRYETCPELVEAQSEAEGVIEGYEFVWRELRVWSLIM